MRGVSSRELHPSDRVGVTGSRPSPLPHPPDMRFSRTRRLARVDCVHEGRRGRRFLIQHFHSQPSARPFHARHSCESGNLTPVLAAPGRREAPFAAKQFNAGCRLTPKMPDTLGSAKAPVEYWEEVGKAILVLQGTDNRRVSWCVGTLVCDRESRTFRTAYPFPNETAQSIQETLLRPIHRHLGAARLPEQDPARLQVSRTLVRVSGRA